MGSKGYGVTLGNRKEISPTADNHYFPKKGFRKTSSGKPGLKLGSSGISSLPLALPPTTLPTLHPIPAPTLGEAPIRPELPEGAGGPAVAASRGEDAREPVHFPPSPSCSEEAGGTGRGAFPGGGCSRSAFGEAERDETLTRL